MATAQLTPEASALRADLTQVNGARRRKDRFMTWLIYGAFALALIPLVSLVWSVLTNGLGRFDLYFLTHSMRNVYGGMDAGGVYHALLGTILITAMTVIISVPIGIITSIYLVEYGKGSLARAVTFFVDVMTGIPSIVAGLFAFSLFYLLVGPQSMSGLTGAVALSVLMIPVVIRSTEEMLRLVPNELREASFALGVPKWLTIIRVVLRTAVAGITTGVMIAIARVIGETAPLLITVGIVANVNWNPLEGRMTTLPVYVYRQYAQGGASVDRAWAGALTLILIVMLLNLAARLVSRYFSPKGAR